MHGVGAEMRCQLMTLPQWFIKLELNKDAFLFQVAYSVGTFPLRNEVRGTVVLLGFKCFLQMLLSP